MHHATQAISKPQTKSNEAAQREIEEAMCRVKEAQNLISAAIDPVIGLLSKDKRRLLFPLSNNNMYMNVRNPTMGEHLCFRRSTNI